MTILDLKNKTCSPTNEECKTYIENKSKTQINYTEYTLIH